MVYRLKGHERTDITPVRPILHGYQNGRCFYCGGPFAEADIHVDHLVPRVFLRHDEIWNLVLADRVCNLSAALRQKLVEEGAEVRMTDEAAQVVVELAHVLELVRALAAVTGATLEEIERV